MLRDSARRWVQSNYSFRQYQEIAERGGFDKDRWQQMATLGWLGVSLPEDVGGLGQPLLEACIVAEELGRAMVLEPFVAVSVLAGHLIDVAADAEQRSNWLPALIAGEKMIAVAHGEKEARGDLQFVNTRATYTGDAWHLSGEKTLVHAAGAADFFLVSARIDGNDTVRSGVSLFVVDRAAEGLVCREYRTVDGRQAADLTLNDVVIARECSVGRPGKAIEPIEYAFERAIIVLCAEAVGMMDHALLLTRDYLLERRQFGVRIASFQALQHRMSDMYIRVNVARAALWRALAFLQNADAGERRRAILSAKIQVGNAARFVCSQAVQLHGGVAITEQFPIGHYFRRMCVFDATFGSAHSHLARLAREFSAAATREAHSVAI